MSVCKYNNSVNVLSTVLSSRLETHRLTPCVGDGDRNSLNLDSIDADRLHRLGC